MSQTTLDLDLRPTYRPSARRMAHRRGPQTSHEAAARMVASGAAATHAERVLEVVKAHGGCTSGELAEHSPFDLTETRRRLTTLLQQGRVRQGEARTCASRGTRMVTWYEAGDDGAHGG